MLFFNFAQTFNLDRSVVKNATEVAITRIDLFVRAKPPATNNKSGITNPGIEVLIVPCLGGIPVINQMGAYRPTEPTEHGAKFAFYSGGQIARAEYDQIQASGNAVVPTTFLFSSPIFAKTDAEYGIIIKFDGSENYVLWSTVQGDILVGTDKISPGPSGRFSGTLFHFIDDPNKGSIISPVGYAYSNTTINPAQANNAALVYTADIAAFTGLDTSYLQTNWSPLPGENLKFRVHVGRYSVNGVPVASLPGYIGNTQLSSALDRPVMTQQANAIVSNNVYRLIAPVQTSEYVMFDAANTVKDDLMYGEPFFQDGPSWPGGTATPLTVTCSPSIAGQNSDYSTRIVQANGSYVLPGGAVFNSIGGFANLFDSKSTVIIKYGSNSYIRGVDSIVSNTQILVDEPFETSMTGATIVFSPIAYLNDIAAPALYGKAVDFMRLYNSTANASQHFTSFSIDSANIVAGGTGYSNSDYIKISGFEQVDSDFSVQGNYAAYANVATNGSGVITAVYLSNTGSGFANISWLQGANVQFLKSLANGQMTANPSTGTTANITFNVGTTLKSLFTTSEFANCRFINLECTRMKPEITVNNPLGSSFTIRHRTLYQSLIDPDPISGKAYYTDTLEESARTDTYSKIFKAHKLNTPGEGKTPTLTSRSNEFNVRYANGATSNANTYGQVFSNTAVFIFDVSSNSDYQAVYIDPEICMSHYSKYIINEEYTNEHTNYGESWSKHVATKVNLQGTNFAEDVLVYLTAYRPANTDFKVYARLHHSSDQDAFDDTNWTLLEQIDGIGMYSSRDNDADYIELTYGLPAFPNTGFTCNGSATIYQGNAHIIGNSTIFGARTTITSGGTGYTNGDIISFTAPTTAYTDDLPIFAYKRSVAATANVGTNPSGVITSLTMIDIGYGWNNQSNVSSFTVLRANGASSAGTGAVLVYNPGLQPNDLIKLYSPYVEFANINYTTAVVNSVISNTEITVKRSFGELSANLVGNVNIGTTSTTLDGDQTTFTSDFSVGDFIAIWANSSVYETHKIIAITDANTLIMDSNGTFTNTATKYAYVTPDTFINNSISVSGLLVDRIAYPHQAFNNYGNENVVRYYNSSMIQFDTYDTMQIKVCLLGDNETTVPKVDDVRGVCCTS